MKQSDAIERILLQQVLQQLMWKMMSKRGFSYFEKDYRNGFYLLEQLKGELLYSDCSQLFSGGVKFLNCNAVAYDMKNVS